MITLEKYDEKKEELFKHSLYEFFSYEHGLKHGVVTLEYAIKHGSIIDRFFITESRVVEALKNEIIFNYFWGIHHSVTRALHDKNVDKDETLEHIKSLIEKHILTKGQVKYCLDSVADVSPHIADKLKPS